MHIEFFRKTRRMPFVKVGMRVEHTHNGRFGRISGANSSGNLNIKFDGDNHTQNCHPYFKMKYFDKDGALIKEYNDGE